MTDPRRQRSTEAILRVFFVQVLDRRYHEITIAGLVEASGVARSTFYEIFPNKDALLAASLQGPFSVLAGCVDPDADVARIEAMLAHFWQNRAMTRSLLVGGVRAKVVKALAVMLDARLAEQRERLLVPRPLAATALAEMLIGAIAAWTQGQAAGDAATLARALHQAGSHAFRE